MGSQLVRSLEVAVLGALTIAVAGCGAAPQITAAPRAQAVSVSAQDADHAQMNAIVKGVLTAQFATLTGSCDTNHDGAISIDEYKTDRTAAAVAIFQAQFDTNHDGTVTAAEYAAALANDATVEAYHHFTEQNMEANIKGSLKGGKMPLAALRPYMVTLGLMGDWPLIGKLTDKLDLNKDGQLLSNQAEGSAFLLTFAQPTLEHAVGLPITQFNLVTRR